MALIKRVTSIEVPLFSEVLFNKVESMGQDSLQVYLLKSNSVKLKAIIDACEMNNGVREVIAITSAMHLTDNEKKHLDNFFSFDGKGCYIEKDNGDSMWEIFLIDDLIYFQFVVL